MIAPDGLDPLYLQHGAVLSLRNEGRFDTGAAAGFAGVTAAAVIVGALLGGWQWAFLFSLVVGLPAAFFVMLSLGIARQSSVTLHPWGLSVEHDDDAWSVGIGELESMRRVEGGLLVRGPEGDKFLAMNAHDPQDVEWLHGAIERRLWPAPQSPSAPRVQRRKVLQLVRR